MSIPLMQYGMDPVYTKIAHRLRDKYRINLAAHIDGVTMIHKKIQDGFWFTPKDHLRLIAALNATNAFVHDNRADFWHAAAASATQGEGYREISDTSIHCQISKATVNMHIDQTGFVWRGPNGEALVGPDAIIHILDELKWPEFVKWVSGKNRWAGKIVERMHPTVPSTANRFMPQIGAKFDIARGGSFDLSTQWSLTFDFHWGCASYLCNRTETFTGLNFSYKHK